MKRYLLFIPIIFLFNNSFANVPPNTSATITEVHWDSQGDWFMEVYFHYIKPGDDTALLVTESDTARFRVYPYFQQDYIVITESHLDQPLTIDKSGDALSLWVPDQEWPGYYDRISDTLDFGDFPGAIVSAPHGNQSVVDLGWDSYFDPITNQYEYVEFKVKDNAPSLGYYQDPARGTFKGRVLDEYHKPVPFIRLDYIRGRDLQQIWTDELGYFEYDQLYAKQYTFTITDGYDNLLDTLIKIEPDSITYCEFILPIRARNKIRGRCCVPGGIPQEGTKIILTPDHDFKPPDTLITDSQGYFSGMISVGNYYIRYSRQGHLPYYISEPTPLFYRRNYANHNMSPGAVIEIPRGALDGNWMNDTVPYWVFDNVWINENDSLIIGPGAHIEFKGDFSFKIYGTLLAQGLKNEMIDFTRGIDDENWNLIGFYGPNSSGSTFDYITFNYADSGILIHNSSPVLGNSILHSSGGGLRISGNSQAEIVGNLTFRSIYCTDNASTLIRRNIFFGYYAGIRLADSANVFAYNNNFIKNSHSISAGSWYNWDSYNTLEMINNIFYDNSYSFAMSPGECFITAEHNLFYISDTNELQWYVPGLGELSRRNFNQDSCDMYFNIFYDPLFVNLVNEDYHLKPESPCIDAGALSFPYDPDGTIADIGAIYYDQLGLIVPEPVEDEIFTIDNYPNPVKGNTTFRITIPKDIIWNDGFIKVFNLEGRIADLIPLPNQSMESFEIIWDQGYNGLPLKAGVYFYVFEIDGIIVASNKLILLNE